MALRTCHAPAGGASTSATRMSAGPRRIRSIRGIIGEGSCADRTVDLKRRSGTPKTPSSSGERGEPIVTFVKLFVSLQSRLVAREDGQTMAEYGVVLAVIALAVIAAFTALSGGI